MLINRHLTSFCCTLALLAGSVTPIRAEELLDVGSALGLSADVQPPVSAPRYPRPASKIAENVTVITAEDIARINAHTLADILHTIPGVQMDYQRTPGSFSYFNIQGAISTQVQVLIDGVPHNDFNQNMTYTGLVPVQNIERIEIIKGAASAAWGQALGGVINIVTKSPNPERQAGGLVSGSLGERLTSDSRGELSGAIDRFGYYLTAGNLHSDGLLPNNGVTQNNLYGKVLYTLPANGELTLGGSYLHNRRGMDEGFVERWGITVHDSGEQQFGYGFIKFDQPLGERLNLSLLGYLSNRWDRVLLGEFAGSTLLTDNDNKTRESRRGGRTSLSWGDSRNSLTGGLEYEQSSAKAWDDNRPADPPLYDKSWERWAAFTNGAASFGPLTVLPGIRFDHTGISSDYLSYTMGATWQLTDKSLLRAYAAKGYGLPNPQFTHGLQRTKTVQAGVESSDITYLWLKGTFFYNDLSGIEFVNDATLHNQVKQGLEVEARTAPMAGFSLTGGYTFLYGRDSDSGERLQTSSSQTVQPHLGKLALNYDNLAHGLKVTLTGNYVSWNGKPTNIPRNGTTWDLHLNWKLLPHSELSPELFFSGRNLFNGVQSVDTELYRNTPRWFDGGVRFSF